MAFVLKKELPAQAKMLWAAVLRRAVFDYVLYKGVAKRKLDWQRAYQYVFIEGMRYEEGLSFEEVCDVFGWCPEYLRRLATKLTRSDVKRLEISTFKDELTYNTIESIVTKVAHWQKSKFAVPFYPRMHDEFTQGVELIRKGTEKFPHYIYVKACVTPITVPLRMVHKEVLARKAPLVQWGTCINGSQIHPN